VSVSAITEHASSPLDWRLFVPERWDDEAMATRRAFDDRDWHRHVTLVLVAHGSSPWSGSATQTGGAGLTLWQLLGELQVVLACWAGACPVCQRPAMVAMPNEMTTRIDLTEFYLTS